MADFQSWLPHQNGLLNDLSTSISLLSPPLNPHFKDIREESWRIAETATQGVVEHIQPTVVSDKRRHDVVEYVQHLLKCNLICEVFPFGSVPLKTYLPDGDIDLTAIGLPNSEEILASDVRRVLEAEERNNDAKFEVKDVQYIHAEVKLVKCLVQNIVVDISFNQSGGLSTLCFLEKVDRVIGKDHLFKCSIILIKAWCYYESRILGAHYGLISTYALETLVLYIFHLFNSSLDGPLAVLYRFLDYYSKFDWDRYCVSLYGPVAISSLPELVAEMPENDGGDLLFTKEFLKKCVDSFSVLTRGLESPSRAFPKKHLNIVDLLKENNNLGRSVNKGSFYRIRSAFTYGAKKLGRILLLPSESIATEINTFFTNTLDRHGSGERPDVQDTISQEGMDSPHSEPQAIDLNGQLCEELNALNLSGVEKENGSRVSDGSDNNKVLVSTSENNISPNGKACYIPHLFFQSKNEYQNGSPSQAKSVPFASPLPSNEQASYISQPDFIETESSMRAERNRASGSSNSKMLADLSGDFDMHNNNFQYVKYNQEYIRGAYFPYYGPSPAYQFHNKSSWDPHWQHGAVAHMNTNGVVHGTPFSPLGTYPITYPFISGAYSMEDMPKPRGTGTYFPITNYHERHSPGRGKNTAATSHFSRYHNNGPVDTPQDDNLEEKGNHEPPPQLQLPFYRGYGRGKIAHLDVSNSPRPLTKEVSPANSCVSQPEGGLELGSFGPVQLGTLSPEPGRRLDSVSSHTQGSGLTMPGSNRERSAQAYRLKDEGDFPPLNG